MEPSQQFVNKWQRMLTIVTEHSTSLPDLTRQFQKLFLQRLLAENILVFLLQYSGLMLSTLSSHVTPLWLASGTATAFIFLRGVSVLPGIFIGSFFACIMAKSGMSIALVCAVIFSMQVFLLLAVTYRFIGPSLIFYSRKTFAKFIFVSALLTGAGSFAFEYFCAPDLHVAESWLANFNGTLIFSFALITLDSYFPQIGNLKKINLIFYSLFGLPIILLLSSSTPCAIIACTLSLLLLTFLMGRRYAWCGAIAAIFLFAITVSLAASHFTATTSGFLQCILCLECLSLVLTIKNPD
jgi:hypothetical protein